MNEKNVKPESISVLEECMQLQLKKSLDYQNPNSTVKQADYYPTGVFTIHEIMHAKMLRAKSVMEAMMNDPEYNENFESLQDSFKDLINYASFAVAYCRGGVDGQESGRDLFNREIKRDDGDQGDDRAASDAIYSGPGPFPKVFKS